MQRLKKSINQRRPFISRRRPRFSTRKKAPGRIRARFELLYLLFSLDRLRDSQRERYRRMLQVVQRFRFAILLVLFTVFFGTLGFMLIEQYTLLEAYYMTIITLASVGYSEVHPLSNTGRIFTTFLILFNLGTFAYAISTITNIFAEGGFVKLVNDFRMDRSIDMLSNHVIVCGYGRHAVEVTSELSKQNLPFVVIDNHPAKVHYLQDETQLLYVEGDATQDHVLEEAGIHRANALITTLPDDSDNLFIVLSARQINPELTIISRANNYADELKIRRAGADHTVVPERIGGFYMAALVSKPDLAELFFMLSSIGNNNIGFEEWMVNRFYTRYHNRSIHESGLLHNQRISLVAVYEPTGECELNPVHDYILKPDNRIVLLGNAEQLAAFRKRVVDPDTQTPGESKS